MAEFGLGLPRPFPDLRRRCSEALRPLAGRRGAGPAGWGPGRCQPGHSSLVPPLSLWGPITPQQYPRPRLRGQQPHRASLGSSLPVESLRRDQAAAASQSEWLRVSGFTASRSHGEIASLWSGCPITTRRLPPGRDPVPASPSSRSPWPRRLRESPWHSFVSPIRGPEAIVKTAVFPRLAGWPCFDLGWRLEGACSHKPRGRIVDRSESLSEWLGSRFSVRPLGV